MTAIAASDRDAAGLEQPEGEQPEIDELDEATGVLPPQAANPTPTVTTVVSSANDRQRPPRLLAA